MLAGSPGGNPNGAPVEMILKNARLQRAKKPRVARSEKPAALEMTGRKGAGRFCFFISCGVGGAAPRLRSPVEKSGRNETSRIEAAA